MLIFICVSSTCIQEHFDATLGINCLVYVIASGYISLISWAIILKEQRLPFLYSSIISYDFIGILSIISNEPFSANCIFFLMRISLAKVNPPFVEITPYANKEMAGAKLPETAQLVPP